MDDAARLVALGAALASKEGILAVRAMQGFFDGQAGDLQRSFRSREQIFLWMRKHGLDACSDKPMAVQLLERLEAESAHRKRVRDAQDEVVRLQLGV